MKITVNGAGGRMGQVLCDLIEKSEKYTLAAKVSAEFETDKENFRNIQNSLERELENAYLKYNPESKFFKFSKIFQKNF